MPERDSLLDALPSAAVGEDGIDHLAGWIHLSQLRPQTAEPVYAIPDLVLEAIERREPGLLSDHELERERNFSCFCKRFNAIGLHYGLFVRHMTLCGSELPQIPDELVRTLAWERSGLPGERYEAADDILESLRHGQVLAQSVLDQLDAYVGWLLTNPAFLAERDALRAKWQGAVEVMGRMPRLPVSLNLHSCGAVRQDNHASEELAADFSAFYARWQLTALATWDLPEPMGANIGGTSLVGRLIGLDNRPVVQLPPIVKLPVRYPLHDLVHGHLDDHLADWHAVISQKHPSGFTYGRWSRVFRVLYLRDVVLARAYEGRFHRRAGALDWILADYFGDDSDESVRRIRLWIQRRLTPNARSTRSDPNR